MPVAEDFPVYTTGFPEGAIIPPLYHYTSAAGLLGMLDKKALWCTQLNFSNDAVESIYARGLIEGVMREYKGLMPTVGSTYSPDPNPAKDFSSLNLPLVFTFSLSEAGDELSQWRGYCPTGGYSIQFDSQQLSAMLKREGLSIGKCVYKLEDQKKFIRKHIIGYETVEKYEEAREKFAMTHWATETLYEINERALKYAPLIKHEAFEAEREWKIFQGHFPTRGWGPVVHQRFLMRSSGLLAKMKFREGKGTLIPYLNIPITAVAEEPVYFPEVVISPTPHRDLARAACQFLLDSQIVYTGGGADPSGVARNSTIPYKNW
jgi:hypothetical protein